MAGWRENKVVGIVAGIVLLISVVIIFYQITSSRPKPRPLSKEEGERLLKELKISPKKKNSPKGISPKDILRKIPEKR